MKTQESPVQAQQLKIGPKTDSAKMRRAAIKAGLATSVVTLVLTSVVDGGLSKRLHLLSGLALVGFSLWHVAQYPSRRRRPARSRKKEQATASAAKNGKVDGPKVQP